MAGNEWFYAQDNRQLGPVTIGALVDMIRRGLVQPSDLVWAEHMSDWRAAMSVPELMPGSVAQVGVSAGAAALAAVGVGGGVGFAGGDALNGANASLNYFSPVGPGYQVAYAGFWLRFAAEIIDWIILIVIVAGMDSVEAVSGPLYIPGPFGFGFRSWAALSWFFAKITVYWLYYALMEASATQATVGKLAVGICVTDMLGQRVSFGRASGRYFGRWISYLTLCVGFMLAGWTRQKQALHDMMAGTLVVRKES